MNFTDKEYWICKEFYQLSLQTYQKAFSSGIKRSNKAAKKFMACMRKTLIPKSLNTANMTIANIFLNLIPDSTQQRGYVEHRL